MILSKIDHLFTLEARLLFYLMKQHFPNPAAQLPRDEPPASLHSVDDRQVPMIPSVSVPLHSKFWKLTTLKSDTPRAWLTRER